MLTAKVEGKYLNYVIEYNEVNDEVAIAELDADGEMLTSIEDDYIVMSLDEYLKLTSGFKQEMLCHGLGDKVKGY